MEIAKLGFRSLLGFAFFVFSGLSQAATGWVQTSDGLVPLSCNSGYAATGAWCTGSYCDNPWLYCDYVGGNWNNRYWTSYFSEEGQYWRDCGSGYVLTGMNCTGDHCDNISLECSYSPSLLSSNCRWTQWFSEEQGGFFFESGWVARGAACRGSDCDDMMYYICQKN